MAAADFEPRLLMAPALYVCAVWLFSETGTDDLFIPLAPAPAPYKPAPDTRAESLMQHLQNWPDK